MKVTYILSILAILFFTFSCGKDKDQRILDSLDGTWQVKQVMHLDQDTTKLPSTGTFTFIKCDLDGSAKACPGSFTFDARQSVDFVYSVMHNGKVISFNSLGEDRYYMPRGSFNVVQRTDERLELEGTLWVFNGSSPTEEQVQVSIVLER